MIDKYPGNSRAGRELRSFGRRRGRSKSSRQTQLLSESLPAVSIDVSQPAPRPLEKLFLRRRSVTAPHETVPGAAQDATPTLPRQSMHTIDEVWLEIGFGGAEHLLWQAQHHPNIGMIGCEPFEDGVIKAVSGIGERQLRNVFLHADDARPLLRWLPQASVGRVFILFPDPWPKKRHAKRRLISPKLLGLLAQIMRPGAQLRIATDIGDYLRTILTAFRSQSDFAWTCGGPQDWRFRPSDWPPTRYEQKAVREGRRCYYLSFVRTTCVKSRQ